jgi:hypothetical protein
VIPGLVLNVGAIQLESVNIARAVDGVVDAKELPFVISKKPTAKRAPGAIIPVFVVELNVTVMSVPFNPEKPLLAPGVGVNVPALYVPQKAAI